jgi:hypothetical protein
MTSTGKLRPHTLIDLLYGAGGGGGGGGDGFGRRQRNKDRQCQIISISTALHCETERARAPSSRALSDTPSFRRSPSVDPIRRRQADKGVTQEFKMPPFHQSPTQW